MLGAKTNEQYRAFQKEIDYCEAEIRKADDRGLQLMEEAEVLATNVSAAESALAEEKRDVEARKKEVAAQASRQKTELVRILAERPRWPPPSPSRCWQRTSGCIRECTTAGSWRGSRTALA